MTRFPIIYRHLYAGPIEIYKGPHLARRPFTHVKMQGGVFVIFFAILLSKVRLRFLIQTVDTFQPVLAVLVKSLTVKCGQHSFPHHWWPIQSAVTERVWCNHTECEFCWADISDVQRGLERPSWHRWTNWPVAQLTFMLLKSLSARYAGTFCTHLTKRNEFIYYF